MMGNKTTIIVFVILIVGLVGLNLRISHLKDKLSLCESKNIILSQSLQFQNQEIEKMRLSSQSYKNNQEKRKKQIITQIQAIPAPVNKDGISCEDALSYIIKLESL